MPNNYLEGLREREKELRRELAAVSAGIDAYIKEQMRGDETPRPGSMPSLDGLGIRQAMTVYLEWAEANRPDPVTLGDLERELTKHEVTSFLGIPFRDMKHKLKSITNVLGAKANQGLFRVHKIDPHSHYTAADVIELKKKTSQ